MRIDDGCDGAIAVLCGMYVYTAEHDIYRCGKKKRKRRRRIRRKKRKRVKEKKKYTIRGKKRKKKKEEREEDSMDVDYIRVIYIIYIPLKNFNIIL